MIIVSTLLSLFTKLLKSLKVSVVRSLSFSLITLPLQRTLSASITPPDFNLSIIKLK